MNTKKIGAVVMSLIITLLGAVLFIWPGETLNVLCWTVGIIAICAAAAGLFFAYRMRQDKLRFVLYLVGAVIAFAIGMVFLLDSDFVTMLFPIIFGVVIMVNGALNIWQTFAHKRGGKAWISHFVLALLTFSLGIIIFANPFRTIGVLLKAIGVVLMFDGVSNIWTTARTM